MSAPARYCYLFRRVMERGVVRAAHHEDAVYTHNTSNWYASMCVGLTAHTYRHAQYCYQCGEWTTRCASVPPMTVELQSQSQSRQQMRARQEDTTTQEESSRHRPVHRRRVWSDTSDDDASDFV